jgi:hypothetical protein
MLNRSSFQTLVVQKVFNISLNLFDLLPFKNRSIAAASRAEPNYNHLNLFGL